jgi:hypothetical protein
MSERNASHDLERSLLEHKLSRLRFLRLVGTGVGVSFMPAFLAGLGGASSAKTLTTGKPPIFSGEQYPIGLWSPPPPTETTEERYQEIAAAGFTFVVGGNGIQDDSTNTAALEAATATNLKFLLTDRTFRKKIRDSTAGANVASANVASAHQGGATPSLLRQTIANGKPRPSTSRATPEITAESTSDPREEVRLRIKRLLNLYAEYPALAGLNLYDEPSRDLFGIVGYAREVLRGLAPNELPYANVWPSYASNSALGTSNYEEYLRLYLSEVAPPLLCFDHYPLLEGTGITSDYFYNWAVIRRYALQAGIPSWAFILSADFGGEGASISKRRRPNEAEILWQISVSLAYGAKGIQYFTYWTPAATHFGEALVSRDGVLTPLYNYARRANNYLRVVGKVLLSLKSDSVVHANEEPLPHGATAFKADRYVRSTSGSPMILGKFRKPTAGTDRYLLAANRSFAKEAKTKITLSGSVRKVLELDSQTGTFASVAQQGTLKLRIAPGGARLYLLRTS